MTGNIGYEGRKVADEGKGIARASAYHVLPYDDAQTVAMVIPARRLYLNVLPYHIEAQFLHGTDIVNKRLVGRGSIKAVRPVALVQHTVEEKGGVVQAEARDAFFIRFHCKGAHGKIAFDMVVPELYFQRVKERVFRRPGARFRNAYDGGKAVSFRVSFGSR